MHNIYTYLYMYFYIYIWLCPCTHIHHSAYSINEDWHHSKTYPSIFIQREQEGFIFANTATKVSTTALRSGAVTPQQPAIYIYPACCSTLCTSALHCP